jgi:hypothetical protein
MSFLNWFKRKPESSETETRAVPGQVTITERAHTPEPVLAELRPETEPQSQLSEDRAAEPQPISPSPEVDPEPATSEASPPFVAPQISVPIRAFYEKLPPHLLTSKKPDLGRIVQIAEQDVVLDSETQEATLSLSILSLSCPEIFNRAIGDAEDIPITFPIRTAETGSEKEIIIRLESVLSDFPPELETPSIRSLIGTPVEIALPLGLIQSQLEHGRVVVPGEIFCRALSSDLKPYFATIDSAAEIPIPLREIFSQIPAEAIKLREDQETDDPEETIPTPFTAQAEEDAKRFSDIPATSTPPADEALQPTIEAPQPSVETPRIDVEKDSKRLQSLFMTDEPLDLTKTIQKVAELPGLRACILNTTTGLKLAGGLEDPGQEKTIAAFLPELFQHTQSSLEGLHAGALETITLCYHLHQLSTFVQGELCLTVSHDNRPFKPGVREKIQAIISELSALSASGKKIFD